MRRTLFPLFFLVITTFSLFASNVYADPPGRVGRLSYMQGTVSFSSAYDKNKNTKEYLLKRISAS